MENKCNNRRCNRYRIEGFPYCRIHITEQLLLSIFQSRETGEKFEDTVLRHGIARAERLLLILRYYENFTRKEIGAALDLSESNIGRRLLEVMDQIYSYIENNTELIYPYLHKLNKKDVKRIQEFNKELISYYANNPNELYKMKPRDFECLIAHLLEILGFNIELTAKSRDGGCDIVAFSSDGIDIKTKYLIECKRYSPNYPVGVRLVRALYGLKAEKEAQHLILATTSYFTRDAIEFSNRPTISNLHLKDFQEIVKLLKKCSKYA